MPTDRLPPPPPPPPPPPKKKPPSEKTFTEQRADGEASPAEGAKGDGPAERASAAERPQEANRTQEAARPEGDRATGSLARLQGESAASRSSSPTGSLAAGLPTKYREVKIPEAKTGEVREQLDNARKDTKDTAEDFREAANAAKTPEDVQAIMKAAGERGQDGKTVLREVLKGQDADADEPNSELLDAVSVEYDKLGMKDHAYAVARAANPKMDKGVREKIMHALRDGDDTEGDIKEALEKADVGAEMAGVGATARAVLGAEKGDRMTATAEIQKAQDAHGEAAAKVAKLDQRLQGMLGQMEGVVTDPKKQEAFISKYKQDHPEYAELDQAAEDLGAVVTKHKDLIAGTLTSGEKAGEDDTKLFQHALKVATTTHKGFEASRDVATQVVQASGTAHPDNLKMVTNEVLPGVFKADMERRINDTGGDSKQAMADFEKSPLGAAIAGAETGTEAGNTIKEFRDQYRDLQKAIELDNPTAAANAVNDAAQNADADKLGGSLAAMGIVLGTISLTKAESFADGTKAVLDIAASGGELANSVGSTLTAMKGGKALAKLGSTAPVISILAGSIEGLKAAFDGKPGEAAVAMGQVGLAVAVLAGVPGANVVAGVVAAGLLIHGLATKEGDGMDLMPYEAEFSQRLTELGMEKGKADFVANNRAGYYNEVKKTLGFDEAKMQRFVHADYPDSMPELTQGLSPQGAEYLENKMYSVRNIVNNEGRPGGNLPTPQSLVTQAHAGDRSDISDVPDFEAADDRLNAHFGGA